MIDPTPTATSTTTGGTGSASSPTLCAQGDNTLTATGLNLTYNGGTSAWHRVETYRYYATDPVAGREHYTQAAGLASATGAPATSPAGP
ncbi:hypothetical protein [Kitasatospora terrestris]|uniref:hypothetical protein n=1 Tax=Kitasatospora terrestris TaxID=258051 RepID=UPI0031EB9EED